VAFAFSGRAAEGLGGLAVQGSPAPTFAGDALGNAQAATVFAAAGSASLSAVGAALPAPAGANGASASAWVSADQGAR
jgi:hypothetical protein